jgi:hypothetical protein
LNRESNSWSRDWIDNPLGCILGLSEGKVLPLADLLPAAGGFGSLVTARIARQPHTVLQAKYAEMDERALKAREKRAGESYR